MDGLVVLASLLLFTLVFLSVTREAPKWPLPMVSGAALTMAGLYWAFFRYFAGGSLGTRLARIAESEGLDREQARDLSLTSKAFTTKDTKVHEGNSLCYLVLVR